MSRPLFERLCRAVALAAVVAGLMASWRTSATDAGRRARRVVVSLPDSLVVDSVSAMPLLQSAVVTNASGLAEESRSAGLGDTLALRLGVVPSPSLRAALGSVRTSGRPLVWRDETGARGLAAAVSRAAAPGAPIELRVATARGAVGGSPSAVPLVLRDAGGVLDSLSKVGAVEAWRLGSAAGGLELQQGRARVRVAVPDSTRARRLLVMAQPGWEGKFVVAALEEAGWLVDGTMRISPTGAVTIGSPQALDTGRYAAVIVLDSMTVDAARLTRFVNRGGGVVLGGDALRMASLAALRPGRVSVLRGAIAGALLTDAPRRGLEAWEFEPAPDAVVLDTDRGDHAHAEPALVARRVGAGRVIAMPYRETWRWRLQGTDDGLAAHRGWWHGAVVAATAAAMPSQSAGGSETYPGSAAPYADLVARVGVPAPDTAWGAAELARANTREQANGISPFLRGLVLLVTALVLLVAEWTSRRLRGAR
ncbi:hypothetical protein [Gemmatimonas sp.]